MKNVTHHCDFHYPLASFELDGASVMKLEEKKQKNTVLIKSIMLKHVI